MEPESVGVESKLCNLSPKKWRDKNIVLKGGHKPPRSQAPTPLLYNAII
jgi:hypothetical protein